MGCILNEYIISRLKFTVSFNPVTSGKTLMFINKVIYYCVQDISVQMATTAKQFQQAHQFKLNPAQQSHGLNFGLPPKHLHKEEIFAEFESLWAQLLHHSATTVEQRTALKARRADVAHLYHDSTIDSRDFTMHKECFRAINSIRKNADIIITEPDKGYGVVLYTKTTTSIK